MKFELMLMDAEARGRAEERAEGEAKRAKDYASLINDGILTLSDAVTRSGLAEENIKKYLESEDSRLLCNT